MESESRLSVPEDSSTAWNSPLPSPLLPGRRRIPLICLIPAAAAWRAQRAPGGTGFCAAVPSASSGTVCSGGQLARRRPRRLCISDVLVGLSPGVVLRASGVTVSDVCKTTYEEIKKDKKHRYVVFYIKDEKQIDVEVIGDRNAAYDQFLEDLQKGGVGECRYGLFDFEYTHQCQGTSEASKKQKLFLMSWCPDTAKVKKKMLYSSSFDALKKSLVGVQKYIQATDLSEASEEAVEEKLRATDRQ